jgi:hypothetical protein
MGSPSTIVPPAQPVYRPGNSNGGYAPASTKKHHKRAVQDTLNRLIAQHGANLPAWANYPEILAEAGLVPADVTLAGLAKASEYAKNLALQGSKAVRLGQPHSGELSNGTRYHVWEDQAHGYKVYRVGGPEPRFLATARIDAPGAKEREIDNNLRTLEAAVAAVEIYHAQHHPEAPPAGNGKEVVREARENGLHRRPRAEHGDKPESGVVPVENPAAPPDNNGESAGSGSPGGEETPKGEGGTTMNVSEKAVRKMFRSIGVKEEDWTQKKLLAKLNNRERFAAILDAVGKTPEDPEDKQLLKKVSSALNRGQTIELTITPPDGENGADPKKSGRKKGAAGKQKPEGEAGEGRSSLKVFGYSARRVVHWMAQRGWSVDEVRKALAGLGVVFHRDKTLQTEWSGGKTEKYGRPAPLTREQAAELEALRK